MPGKLERTGRAVEIWNTDAYRYREDAPALYQSHPFVLAIAPDGRARGVLFDSHRRGVIGTAPDGVEAVFEGEPYAVHVLEGDGPEAVLRTLAELAGRMALPPLWALGYHQCRYSYMDEEEVRSIAAGFDERGLPLDALWLDIDAMDRFRSFTFDPDRFPDPAGLVDDLHARDLRAVTILDPGLAVADDYAPTAEGLADDHFVVDERGDPVRGKVWPGACHFPDFVRPETREWWAGLVERFLGACPLDGLWNDMNEPALFGRSTKTLCYKAVHRGPGGGTHGELHNLYGHLMLEASRVGFERARPGRRPFVLTRSGHIGTARLAATWTGDNEATWDHLRWSIPMALGLGLSGQPFVGPDVGGFALDPDPELFARWFELGAYLPFFRGHAEKGTCRKEPWSFGDETLAHVRAALERRMELLPTLYTLFAEAARTGVPLARPLFFADPADPELHEVYDELLLGRDLLVAPVVDPDVDERVVRFPPNEGGWVPFPDGGAALTDRHATVPAPLGKTPVFARAGSIVVAAPVTLRSGAARAADRIAHAFPGPDGRATGELWEDAGEGFDFERGAFRRTRLELTGAGDRPTLAVSTEGDFQPPARSWTVLVHGEDGPFPIEGTALD